MVFFWAPILSLIVPLSILISWKIVLSRLLKKAFSTLLLLGVKAVDSFNSEGPECPHSLSLSCKLTISKPKPPLSSKTLWNITLNQPTHTVVHAPSSNLFPESYLHQGCYKICFPNYPGFKLSKIVHPWKTRLLLTLVVKNLPANPGDKRDANSIPGSGRCPGGGHSNPLQCSCLENPHGQKSLVGYSP